MKQNRTQTHVLPNGHRLHSFTLNNTLEWSVRAQGREVCPRAMPCSLLAPARSGTGMTGLVFPSKLWQLSLITMKPLLLSYHGLPLRLTPIINDLFDLCFAMDEGF